MRSVLIITLILALLHCVGCERQETQQTIIGGPPEGDTTVSEEQAPPAEEGGEMVMQITSSAFENGQTIPVKYTADGDDISPPLSFSGVPEDAAELALICHDPDAPRAGGWTHWVVYGMAPDIGGLPEAVPTTATVDEPALIQGKNSWGKSGYGGPSPPPGKPHRYQFFLYALSERLDLEPGATKDELEAAMEGKVLAQAMLEGLYGR